jgi:aryl carrier-like protein
VLQKARVWEKVFGFGPIGVRDNFFELGGHSLLAVRLFAQVEKLTGKRLPLVTLFQAPTIEQLANVMRRDGWEAPWWCLVPIKPDGSRPPF